MLLSAALPPPPVDAILTKRCSRVPARRRAGFACPTQEGLAVQTRPRKKKVRKARFKRCPKCNKLMAKNKVRCKTCHLLQPKR